MRKEHHIAGHIDMHGAQHHGYHKVIEGTYREIYEPGEESFHDVCRFKFQVYIERSRYFYVCHTQIYILVYILLNDLVCLPVFPHK